MTVTTTPAQYERTFVYGNTGQFLGFAIVKTGTQRFESVNIWIEAEEPKLQEYLDKLNNENLLRQYWPTFGDPDVNTLVENPDWEPLELEEIDTIDHERSDLVPVYEQYIDPTGLPQKRDTGEIDWANSNVVYKKAMAPDPQKAQARVFKAMELVARQRAELALR